MGKLRVILPAVLLLLPSFLRAETGFAIPLYDLDLQSFVPITQRQSDPKKAADLVKAPERYAALAERIEKTGGAESDERKLFNAYASICYRQALIYDPANPAIYYNVGMLLRTIDENEVAAGYLTRAVELEPWDN